MRQHVFNLEFSINVPKPFHRLVGAGYIPVAGVWQLGCDTFASWNEFHPLAQVKS